MQPNLIDIPPVYYPFDSNEPFKECLVCGTDLTLGTRDYFVEKAIKNHVEFKVKDVVFEYAMCSECAEKNAEIDVRGVAAKYAKLLFATREFYAESAGVPDRRRWTYR